MVAKYILGILTLGFILILLGNVSADYIYHASNPYGTSMKTNSDSQITFNTNISYTPAYAPYEYYDYSPYYSYYAYNTYYTAYNPIYYVPSYYSYVPYYPSYVSLTVTPISPYYYNYYYVPNIIYYT